MRILKYGPFPLTSRGIDAAVPEDTIGAYAIGPSSKPGAITVRRIGRSDTDLRDRLKAYTQDVDYADCTHFRFEPCISAWRAYQLECVLFHDWSPSKNIDHPDAPDGMDPDCPVQGCPIKRQDP